MGVNIFISCVAVLLLILLIIYRTRFWGHPKEDYNAMVSWTRAWIVFCICSIISWATGTMDKILTNLVVPPGQLEDPQWIAWTAGCFVLIFVAYWVIWARWTVIFDRKRYLVPQIIFGFVWGASIGQIFLIFWHFAGIFGFPVWGRWILAYLCMASHGLWMDLYWDVYVLPEHDTPWSLKWKVICSHIPNMMACLTYLAIYNNQGIFILLQAFALTGAAVSMRVPPFWVKGNINPPRTGPGLFGLPHAIGYVEEEQEP
jgi:hypothetical protein